MKKTVLIAAISVMAMMGAGCSVIQPNKSKYPKTMSGSTATKIETPDQSAAQTPQVAPADTASVQTPATELLTMNSRLARNLGGEWSIIMVNGVTIDRDENMPYITFEPSSASFYANNGCNTLNGAYSVSAADVVTFYNVLSTLRYCADVQFDNMINTIIADNVSTKLNMTEVGQETFVDFVGEGGKTIMRLRRGNLEFLNGQWVVESIAVWKNLKFRPMCSLTSPSLSFTATPAATLSTVKFTLITAVPTPWISAIWVLPVWPAPTLPKRPHSWLPWSRLPRPSATATTRLCCSMPTARSL